MSIVASGSNADLDDGAALEPLAPARAVVAAARREPRRQRFRPRGDEHDKARTIEPAHLDDHRPRNVADDRVAGGEPRLDLARHAVMKPVRAPGEREAPLRARRRERLFGERVVILESVGAAGDDAARGEDAVAFAESTGEAADQRVLAGAARADDGDEQARRGQSLG